MISERKAAKAYTSFWQDLMPMGDPYLRTVNLQLERFAKPMPSQVKPARRALVNEIAFRFFRGYVAGEVLPDHMDIGDAAVTHVIQTTVQYIRRLPRSGIDAESTELLAPCEYSEAIELMRRIIAFFEDGKAMPKLIVSPEFPGCGLIQACAGDVFADRTLYELKSGERDFRLVDLRQMLVYAALSYASSRYDIRKCCLVNPRRGVCYLDELETIARRTAGLTANVMLREIIDFFSPESVSK